MTAGAPVTALLRRMTDDDVPAVLALEPLLFPDDPWSEATLREELAQVPDTRWYLVAERDGEVVDLPRERWFEMVRNRPSPAESGSSP